LVERAQIGSMVKQMRRGRLYRVFREVNFFGVGGAFFFIVVIVVKTNKFIGNE
jgi:hypothetical protein